MTKLAMAKAISVENRLRAIYPAHDEYEIEVYTDDRSIVLWAKRDGKEVRAYAGDRTPNFSLLLEFTALIDTLDRPEAANDNNN